jgi:hypothetical protein
MKVNKIPSGEDVTYPVLMAYYNQNGLYQDLMANAFYLNEWHEAMKPLRNPANRSVEFFVNKIIPGVLPESLPIQTDNESIIDPIHQIWKWSNLNANKSPSVRWLSIYGDIFIHPTSNAEGSRVYHQFIEPQYVTNWSEDERGNITMSRIDIPLDEKGKTHTELWLPDTYFIWEHNLGASTPVKNLNGLIQTGDSIEDYGIDFVPFVHAKFRDIGEKRGIGAFTHCLDKIDEANRMATRLHQLLFRYNKAIWAVMANSVDSEGMPLPPPTISADALTQEDDDIMRLPGTTSMDALIPDLKYQDALSILQDHMKEIEKDLPELAYYELVDQNLSGIAMARALGGAVSRAEEARANYEQALIRADEMALTMGVSLSIFSGIGAFENGDFEHQFKHREIFEVSATEKAAALKNLFDSGVTGYDAMKLAGYADDEIPESLKTERVNALKTAQIQSQIEQPISDVSI